jgi:hypothetical protein
MLIENLYGLANIIRKKASKVDETTWCAYLDCLRECGYEKWSTLLNEPHCFYDNTNIFNDDTGIHVTLKYRYVRIIILGLSLEYIEKLKNNTEFIHLIRILPTRVISCNNYYYGYSELQKSFPETFKFKKKLSSELFEFFTI